MSDTCNSKFDEFCLEETKNYTSEEKTSESASIFYDLVNSPEAQAIAAVATVGAAFAYKAMTGNDVCVAGVCTNPHHNHDDCGHL